MNDASARRSAHRRVGAAAIAAFLALLLLGATRGPAQADQAAPAATPTPAYQPSQPARVVPDPGLRDDHDGYEPHDFDGGPRRGGQCEGLGGGGGGGAPAAPAPSTGGSQT